MTAKRGTLWKTSWRRQKPAVPQAPVSMWFFNNFQVDFTGRVWYQQPLDTPTVGDVAGGSFWAGMIGASGPVFGAGIKRSEAPPDFDDWRVLDQDSSLFTPPVVTEGLSSGGLSESQFEPIQPLGVTPPVLRAIVTLMVVEDLGDGTRRQDLWVDGLLRQSTIFAGIYNAKAGRFGTAMPGDGYLNSWAGGNVVPTADEIRTWFSASRYASPFPAAQSIPGKTLDRFDAGAVPGAVPSPLLNLDSGQDMLSGSEGVSPFFANTLFDASFAY